MVNLFEKILKKRIENYDVISFDVFDTLIKRNVNSPVDIFKLVEKKYNKKKKDCIDFTARRIEAEIKARKISASEEITLKEIYDCIELEDNIKNTLLKMEIEYELKYTIPNEKIIGIYNYCKFRNKKIIAISDMYLPENIVEKILINNGFEFDNIYLSCTYKKTKLTGNLFKKVLELEKISNKNILHIGDSYKADCLGSFKANIDFFHIKKKNKNTVFINYKNAESSINDNIIYSTINNKCTKFNTIFEKFGYEVVGPIVVDFCSYVHNKAIEQNKKNILFCARDMYIVKKVYELLKFNENIQYFYCSRKSLYLPYLYCNNSFDVFKHILPVSEKSILIEDLLKSYNINIDDIEKELKKYNLYASRNYSIEFLKKSTDFKDFFNNIVSNYIHNVGETQYKNFKKYYNSLTPNGNGIIVDLGWRGTTQVIIDKMLNIENYGIYLGITENKNLNRYSTYIFDGNSNKYYERLYSFMIIIETVFSATHGTTISYNDSLNNPYNLKSDNINKEVVELIHNGIMNYACDILPFIDDFDDIKPYFIIDKFVEMGTSPSLLFAKTFGDIFSENLDYNKIASPKKRAFYFMNLKQFKQDLNNSDWKVGFLKRLFILDFPYYKLYNYMKNKRDRRI
ncbi:MAG TPA: hypothetical protein PK993_00120 [Clostridia bacterium]|nr:hypothetical protein [Clostridia bacterium]